MLPDLGEHLGEFGFSPRADAHGRSGLGKADRERGADPGGRARHEYVLVLDGIRHDDLLHESGPVSVGWR